MRSAAVRFSPAATAVLASFTNRFDHEERRGERWSMSEGYLLPRVCPQARVQCEMASDTTCLRAPFRGTKIKSTKLSNKLISKGLLGQNHWVYRLVCSEDVTAIYEFERVLARGSAGIVHLARHKEMGYYRAVKVTPFVEENHDDLINKVYTLMDLDHPHIIKFSRMYADNDHLYMVSELCNGPSLYDRIVKGKMTEQDVGMAIRHILRAVQCCHSHYMGDYDITPENFRYSDSKCTKLMMIDRLGLDNGFKRNAKYSAPEVLNHGSCGPESDVWSCGLILFLMATGSTLYPMSASESEVAALLQDRNWIQERLAWAHSMRASEECLDLLNKMLCCDHHLRITVGDALQHPFIKNSYQVPIHPEEEDAAVRIIGSTAQMFATFGAEPVLVRAALTVMVHIIGHTSKETSAHRLAYSMLDPKGLGDLSVELMEIMLDEIGFRVPENLTAVFRSVDFNRDGYISYKDFLAATLPASFRCREDLCRRVFSLFDQNNDGFIDQDDLASTFMCKEEKGNEEFLKLCRQAISELTPSSGAQADRIDFDQFFFAILGDRPPWVTAQKYVPPVIEKTDEQNARLKQCLSKSVLFKNLSEEDMMSVIGAMMEVRVEPKVRVINQGDIGDFLFVVESGSLDCLLKVEDADEVLLIKTFEPGDVFGELALLYNRPRAASIESLSDCVLWQLDRVTFNNIVKRARHRSSTRF